LPLAARHEQLYGRQLHGVPPHACDAHKKQHTSAGQKGGTDLGMDLGKQPRRLPSGVRSMDLDLGIQLNWGRTSALAPLQCRYITCLTPRLASQLAARPGGCQATTRGAHGAKIQAARRRRSAALVLGQSPMGHAELPITYAGAWRAARAGQWAWTRPHARTLPEAWT
jgi:hypothetical protein